MGRVFGSALAAMAFSMCLWSSSSMAADAFNAQKATADLLLGKPKATDALKQTYGNLDTALDCNAVAIGTYKLYLAGQLDDNSAAVYGLLMWLSASAVTSFQTDMGIDQDALLKLSTVSTARFNADQGGTIQKCQQVVLASYKALQALQ